MTEPKDTPLRVTVHRGVMRIEIGVDVLAFGYLNSLHAWQMANPNPSGNIKPEDVYRIKNRVGFAGDVKRELLAEAEDGSSLLTELLDKASAKAVEEGSMYFIAEEQAP